MTGTAALAWFKRNLRVRLSATTDRSLAYALRGFASRLRWHCHFMQRREDEPAIEWRNVARTVDGLRPGDGVHKSPIHAGRLQA